VVRDGIVIYEGNIASLRRFKDDVRSVRQGFECGVSVENFNDVKEGDALEFFEVVEVPR
jgi:translation initiation factor IF-2